MNKGERSEAQPFHAGTRRERGYRWGNPKIRPRSNKISVIHSKERSDRPMDVSMQYTSRSLRRLRTRHRNFLRSGLEIFGFWGGVYQFASAFLMVLGNDKRCTISSFSDGSFLVPADFCYRIFFKRVFDEYSGF